MEIIFHRYGSICEPDIIDTFQAMGIHVIEEDTEIRQKSILSAERIRLLGEQILTHQAAFVFSINYFPYISQLCERLQTLYVCLSVDCPVLELFSETIRNRCNRIFLFDHNQYQLFHKENPEGIFYLPLAANTDRWNAVLAAQTPSDSFPAGEQYEISFVGSLYNEKSPYAALALPEFYRGFGDGLIEAQLKLPGLGLIEEAITPELIAAFRTCSDTFYMLPDAFQDTDPYVTCNYYLGMEASSLERIRTLNALASHFQVDLFTRSNTAPLTGSVSGNTGGKGVRCHGGVTTHREMPLVFYQSKINLNITIRSIQTGLSQRIWDVLGCRGFLLSNYQAEIPEYLEIGRDLDCYESLPELQDKVSYYLAHEDLRRDIADHGYQTVKEKHTWTQRILQMLRAVSSSLKEDS